MKRTVGIVLAGVLALIGVTGPAFAAYTSENRAGVFSAVKRDPANTCVSVMNSNGSISRGVARIGLYTCESGCISVWAYTGSDWGTLGQCSQEMAIYPTTLPGHLYICRGNSHTLIRAAPSSSATVIGTVIANTKVAADRLQLQLKGSSGSDGLGWYRISWRGRRAWVASYRVANTSDGCAGWTSYWSYSRHR